MNAGHFQAGHDPRRAVGARQKSAKGLASGVISTLGRLAPQYIDNLQSLAASGDAVAQGVVVMLVLIASAIRDGASS